MTTLPQTAAVRLPRPGFSAVPMPTAIPVGAMGPGGGSPAMTGADAWRVIRSNFWLILLMLVVSAGAGYGINYWLAKYHPHFTAEGTVVVNGVVETTDEDALKNNDQYNISAIPIEVRLHSTLLKSTPLFAEVLKDPNGEIRSTAWFRRHATIQEAKGDLSDYLEIISSPDSRLIGISMTDSDPQSAQVIVKSVVDQYIKDQQDRNRDLRYNYNLDLENQRTTEEGKVKLDDGDIADLLADLNADGVTGTMGKISEKDMQLQQFIQSEQNAQLDEEAAKEEFENLETHIANDPNNVPQVETQLNTDSSIMMLRQQANEAEISLSAASTGAMMADSPELERMQKQAGMIEKRLEMAEERARVRYRSEIEETMREKLDSAKRRVDALDTNIKALANQMTTLSEKEQQLLLKQSERDRDNTKLEKTEDELEQIANYNAKHDVAGVSWESLPEVPEIPSFPKLYQTMIVAVAAGLVLALGVVFLRELLDTSIRSPRDITRVGSINLLGMVPHEDDDPQSAGARLPVVIFEAPHSMMAEQLRQVRTRLQHSSSLDTMRTILVTSPSPGDGKSTIACNLASGLALNGRRILLVDANFRRPELHRVFNLANDQGFSDVLNSLEVFEHAVQETQVPNLFVLPSGHKPTNATELVESQLLVDFIERALEEFDHVIFDSGPLLFVSETVALAPRVDGVISVVRARTNTRGVLSRMRDTLRQIKAEHLGVVLNAVRAQGGGYYGRNIRTYYEYQNNGGGRAA
jgi:succinoglycan biosynthesis transport protein ExoP